MKKLVCLMMVGALLVAFAACTSKTVKGFQVSKAVAETVLYESRLLYNAGKMDSTSFDKVKDMYNKVKVAQDAAINARIAYLKSGLETDKKQLENWTGVVGELTAGLVAIATQFGFADKVLIGG